MFLNKSHAIITRLTELHFATLVDTNHVNTITRKITFIQNTQSLSNCPNFCMASCIWARSFRVRLIRDVKSPGNRTPPLMDNRSVPVMFARRLKGQLHGVLRVCHGRYSTTGPLPVKLFFEEFFS